MSNKHHTEAKQDKTVKLLKKVLETLIKCNNNITLSDRVYKKINFSNQQIIDALNEFATYEDKLDGVLINSPSTISKNSTYTALISDAKIKRIEYEREMGGGSGATGDISLDYLNLKEEYQILQHKYKILQNKNLALEKIFNDADVQLEKLHQEEEIGFNNSDYISEDGKYKRILETLLKAQKDDFLYVLEEPKNGKDGFLSYTNAEGEKIRVLSLSDFRELADSEDLQDSILGTLE